MGYVHGAMSGHHTPPHCTPYTDDTLNTVTVQGLACGANLWFGGFPYPVNPGRPEWSKVQTRGKPLVATAQVKYMSAGER